jgi:hypothetical protein
MVIYVPGLGFICEVLAGADFLRIVVGATDLALATSKSNVDETAGVCKSLLRAALTIVGVS